MSYKPFYRDTNGNLVPLLLHFQKADESEIAKKLGATTIGSVNEPIYLKEGVPTKCGELDSKIVNLIYPVGSLYMSVNATSPESLFGGKWEQLKDRFLLGAGDSYGAGATGGEENHTLTIDEMPTHTHEQNPHNHTQDAHRHSLYSNDTWGDATIGMGQGSNGSGVSSVKNGKNGNKGWYDKDYGGGQLVSNVVPTINNTIAINKDSGGNGTHNNMPPYLAVYMWKRIA